MTRTRSKTVVHAHQQRMSSAVHALLMVDCTSCASNAGLLECQTVPSVVVAPLCNRPTAVSKGRVTAPLTPRTRSACLAASVGWSADQHESVHPCRRQKRHRRGCESRLLLWLRWPRRQRPGFVPESTRYQFSLSCCNGVYRVEAYTHAACELPYSQMRWSPWWLPSRHLEHTAELRLVAQ